MKDLLIEYIQSANDLKKRIEKYEEEHKEVLENTNYRYYLILHLSKIHLYLS